MSKIEYMPRAYSGSEAHIFVSYSHKDADDVYPLIGELGVDGYRVWYDGGIEPSTDWLAYITDKVTSCECMICMISGNYSTSMYCLQELDLAISHGKKILPVYLDNIRLDDTRQGILDRMQALFFGDYTSTDRFFEKLYQASALKPCYDEKLAVGEACDEDKRRLEALKASPEYRCRALLRVVKSGKLPPDTICAELDAIVYDVAEKADLIAGFWKGVKEEIRALEAEESAIKVRRESKKSVCDSLEHYLTSMLLDANVEKVELANRITFRKSEETQIADPDAFVAWAEQNNTTLLKYTPPKPNTTAIKQAIKAGMVLEGVEVVVKKNIQIK